MPCETIFAPAVFSIVNLQAVVEEPGVSPPSMIIRSNVDWKITVSWTTTGSGTSMICGRWHLLVFAESIGPGSEVILVDPGDHIFDLEPGPSPVSYTRTFDVPQGRLPVVGGHGVTLYKLVTSLTYFAADGSRGPIACYEEGPIVQMYDAQP